MDEEWYDVCLVWCVDSGDIVVYVDGFDILLMIVNDKIFMEGWVGFGFFDNFGCLCEFLVMMVLIDIMVLVVMVKSGVEFMVGCDGVYSVVLFKLNDVGKVDCLMFNGVEKDLMDDVWFDLNGVKFGVFGVVVGVNMFVVYDVVGNVMMVCFMFDVMVLLVIVKEGLGFMVGVGGIYSLVLYKFYDVGKIDCLMLNGVVKDLMDNVWFDFNGVKFGVFGVVFGVNILVVYDVVGNVIIVDFILMVF